MRIAYLDGWRGLAVLLVFVGHFITTWGVNYGRLGVELFFVLSGRLMAEILFERELDLGKFYWRRFSRVFPALLVFATVIYFAAAGTVWAPSLPQFLAVITLTANHAMYWVGSPAMYNHIWSLCVEEHMYLLLGAIAWLHRRRGLPVLPLLLGLAALFILHGAARTFVGGNYYQVYWRSDVRGASILLGAAAWLLARKHRLAPAWPIPAALALAGVLLNAHPVPDPVKYSLGTGLIAGSLALLPSFAARFSPVLENGALLRVGVLSYSLYLWQQPFAKLMSVGQGVPLMLALAVGFGLLSYHVVERPARSVLNRIMVRPPLRAG